jgi:hypothetical protein
VGQHFSRQLIDGTKGLAQMPNIEYVREVGSERHRDRDETDCAPRDGGYRRQPEAEGGAPVLPCARVEHRGWPLILETRHQAGITEDH